MNIVDAGRVASERSVATFQERNLSMLRTVVNRLGELRERVVFMGGTILPFLFTEPDVRAVRHAKDVDVIFNPSDESDLHAFEDELCDRGFEKFSNGPVTRWRADGTTLDVLPTDSDLIGFPAKWLGEAWRTATDAVLPDEPIVKIAAAPAFLAAKLDAFRRRGPETYFDSNDISDVVLLCAGRREAATEVLSYSDSALRQFVTAELNALHAAIAGDRRLRSKGHNLNRIPAHIVQRALDRIGRFVT